MNMCNLWKDFLNDTLPMRKNEYWKYANLDHLKNLAIDEVATQTKIDEFICAKKSSHSHFVVIVNGELSEKYSDNIAHKIEATSVTDDKIKYPFASFNSSTNNAGLAIKVESKLDQPIYILHVTTNQLSQTNISIELNENTSAHIVEEFVTVDSKNYLNNIVSTVELGKHAELTYEKIQAEAKSATHIAAMFVEQAENSLSQFNYVTHGSAFARDDLVVRLSGQSSRCETSGAYKLKTENQFVDYHIDIHHIAKHTTSDMLFKGVLGEKTKAVFNGRLYVEKDAQRISAEQGNHHLLLANNAESYSKPELEIYADDVKCKHGATTGELDEEALFYLRARGIDEDAAKAILLRGFMAEVLDRIKHEELKSQALEWLS